MNMLKKICGALACVWGLSLAASEVPVNDLRGIDAHLRKDKEMFFLSNGFIALKGGVLSNIRRFGNYGLKGWNSQSEVWAHPAFKRNPEDEHYRSASFECPLDAISALVQWLFPSPDGEGFSPNQRQDDPVSMLYKTPEVFGKLLKAIQEGVSDAKDLMKKTYNSKDKRKLAFIKVVYDALVQDGTFAPHYDRLYPKHMGLHALLGYLWATAGSRENALEIMNKAGLLKTSTFSPPSELNEEQENIARKLSKAVRAKKLKKVMNENYYTYPVSKKKILSGNSVSREQKAYAGYIYTVIEQKYPEKLEYGKVQYMSSYDGKIINFADCGETMLRNFFNFVVSMPGGKFNSEILSSFQGGKMNEIRDFYQTRPEIGDQKNQDARNVWGKIVSNLNGTPVPGTSNTDVRYSHGEYKYIDIDSSKWGIANILNVFGRLTEDEQLTAHWTVSPEDMNEGNQSVIFREVATKIDRFCEIFSREKFNLTWSLNRQNDDKKITSLNNIRLYFKVNGGSDGVIGFDISPGHFEFIPFAQDGKNWRTDSTIASHDLLKIFYQADQNTYSNPVMPFLKQQISNLVNDYIPYRGDPLLEEEQTKRVTLSLRYLYKTFASVIQADRHAQREMLSGLVRVMQHPQMKNNEHIKAIIFDFIKSLKIAQFVLLEYIEQGLSSAPELLPLFVQGIDIEDQVQKAKFSTRVLQGLFAKHGVQAFEGIGVPAYIKVLGDLVEHGADFSFLFLGDLQTILSYPDILNFVIEKKGYFVMETWEERIQSMILNILVEPVHSSESIFILVKYLLDKNPNLLINHGEAILEKIERLHGEGNIKSIRLIIDRMPSWGAKKANLLLRFALKNGILDLANFSLEKGATCDAIKGHIPDIIEKCAREGNIATLSFIHQKSSGLLTTEGKKVIETAASYRQIEVVRFLSEEANIPSFNAFHIATSKGDFDMVRYFAGKGRFDVNHLEEMSYGIGEPALCNAAAGGHDQIVKFLLEEKRAKVLPCRFNELLIVKAIHSKNMNVFKMVADATKMQSEQDFLSMARSPTSSSDKGNALWHAIKYAQNLEMVEILLEKEPRFNLKEMLFDAADLEDPSILKFLISKIENLDINSVTYKYWGSKLLHQSSFEAIKVLVEEFKANLHVRDEKGNTPLHVMANDGRHVTAQYLLSKGANLYARNLEGKTPLDILRDRKKGYGGPDYKQRLEKMEKILDDYIKEGASSKIARFWKRKKSLDR